MTYQAVKGIFQISDSGPGSRHPAPMQIQRIMLDRRAVMERVERVRKASGETKKGDFAMSIGILPPNYSKLLRGEAFLTADQLYAIWRLYGADPRYIMEGVETALPADLLARIRAQAANT